VSAPDWLALCRGSRDDVRAVLGSMPGRAQREPVVGDGEGGDDTTAIDAAAEAVILARFRGEDVRIVSEEAGLEGDGRWTIVVDPIDGSLNAKRGIPFFSISIAVADGDTMDDVVFGYVYDFGANEEWMAVRGEGALLNGGPIPDLPRDYIQFMSLEATRAQLVYESLAKLAPLTDRVRVMGAQALTYCHMAAGRTDAVVCLKPSRSVDFAAAQLIVRERGCAIELVDDPPLDSARLDLVPRSRIVAAANSELIAAIAVALGPL
jgi:myo-inositol-1(or 4)-monophosphatase